MTNLCCKGFKASAVKAGIKYEGRLDLALLFCETEASAAAVFTQNRFAAAPVLLSRRHIAAGRARALIVNSGNANCATSKKGEADALAMAEGVAQEMGISPELVQVASTGVIGQPLPMEKIVSKTAILAETLSEDGFMDLADAILTTDLVKKTASREIEIDGKPVTLCGTAKGSGMIRPDMATMLGFVITDADIAPERLDALLRRAVNKSFNRISVDGDTSTNDTVLVMASGASNAAITDRNEALFEEALTGLCAELSERIVEDGEGATKVVRITVTGAATDEDALAAADSIAHSPLVKTAMFGEDANWGRLAMAVGKSGAEVDPETVTIAFDEALLVKDGVWLGEKAEAAATLVMKQKRYEIRVDLGLGRGEDFMLTCDFSHEYVSINADYRS